MLPTTLATGNCLKTSWTGHDEALGVVAFAVVIQTAFRIEFGANLLGHRWLEAEHFLDRRKYTLMELTMRANIFCNPDHILKMSSRTGADLRPVKNSAKLGKNDERPKNTSPRARLKKLMAAALKPATVLVADDVPTRLTSFPKLVPCNSIWIKDDFP